MSERMTLREWVIRAFRDRCQPDGVELIVGNTAGPWVAHEPATHVAFIFEPREDYDKPKKPDFAAAGVGEDEALENLLRLIEGRASEGRMGGRPYHEVFPSPFFSQAIPML